MAVGGDGGPRPRRRDGARTAEAARALGINRLRAGRGREQQPRQPGDQRAELRRGPGRRRPLRRGDRKGLQSRGASSRRSSTSRGTATRDRLHRSLPVLASPGRASSGRARPVPRRDRGGRRRGDDRALACRSSIRKPFRCAISCEGRESRDGRPFGGRARATVPASLSHAVTRTCSAMCSVSGGWSSPMRSTWVESSTTSRGRSLRPGDPRGGRPGPQVAGHRCGDGGGPRALRERPSHGSRGWTRPSRRIFASKEIDPRRGTSIPPHTARVDGRSTARRRGDRGVGP